MTLRLITLCDGCHAARHPHLQGTLARRAIERWGWRLAKWLDGQGDLAGLDDSLGATLRLLGVTRFRTPQLDVVLAALRGESLLLVSATGSERTMLGGAFWGRNLDALNDIMRGNFGPLPSEFRLVWKDAALSRKRLPGTGPASFASLFDIISGNRTLSLCSSSIV